MLTWLYVSGFTVVEELQLEFNTGFTALTGETGAGKSIIVDALGLVLGERANPADVRPGSEQCEVAARFTVDAPTAALLETWGCPCEEDELLIRRTVRPHGSRAWLNGAPVPIRQLKELAERLVEVRGQYAQLQLLVATRQCELLDAYAGHDGLLASVAERYQEWHAARKALDRLDDVEQRAGETDILGHYVQELQALDYRPGELQRLENEQARLGNAGHLAESLQDVAARLENDQEIGAAWRVLNDCVRFDGALEPLAGELQQAQEYATEVGRKVRAYLDGLELDGTRLREVEQRLDAINELAHKHHVPADELPAKLTALETELTSLENVGRDRAALQRKLDKAFKRYQEPARALGASREAAAARMSAAITTTIRRLGMPRGKCCIEVRHQAEAGPSRHGLDQVEFTATANPGLPLRPLASAASGGELSRLYLATYSQACGNTTLIFDEIDTGVGGAVAELIGQLLSELAKSRQVLCITHLPQVACHARHHLLVHKHTHAARALTEVQPLNGEQRIEEVARMLGGLRITERTRAHAREMLHASA